MGSNLNPFSAATA